MTHSKLFLRRIRSFVRRDSRMTDAQENAFNQLWPTYGLEITKGIIDYSIVFNRVAPTVLEIGFGSGHSLLAAAECYPPYNFIGIETHRPGIGTLLLHLKTKPLHNIRVYYADAVDVLAQCIPDNSLSVIQIFFPDPWRKRRHHKRRLIQPAFVKSVVQKLEVGGEIHLATDWEDYAKHMMNVLSHESALINMAGLGCYSDRSSQRPVITKFEQRGQNAGHEIWELRFVKR
jgi:tRNA (guanine-N7-)-methyltransferase